MLSRASLSVGEHEQLFIAGSTHPQEEEYLLACYQRVSRTVSSLVLVLAPRGWWYRWPPLPLPDPAYLRFRLVTAYGTTDHAPEPDDVVSYLSWCRDWRRAHWG